MDDHKICQSCGLPFDQEHKQFIAKKRDGSDSIYCTFCYENGKFRNTNMTLEEAVEVGVPHLARKIGEAAAREQLSKLLPTLKRWQGK